MNSARSGVIALVGGAAFAASFLFAGTAVVVLQLALLHQSEPKFGGPSDNFALGLYLVGAGCLFAAPAFVIATSSFRAWRQLTVKRAFILAVPAGALAFLTHLLGAIPLAFSWLVPRAAGPAVIYGVYFCISGLLTGLLAVVIVRSQRAPAAAS